MTLKKGVALLVVAAAILAYGYARSHGSLAIPAPSPQSSATNTALTLITEPDAGIIPIATLIQNASSSVDMVMYELEDTKIEQALAADAARGIKVRVLLNLGYYGKKENNLNDEAYQYLSSHGVEVHWTPARFALTHQKTILIDQDSAIIMTLNLTPQYYASGREFAVIDGDANDISAIETTFNADWDDQDIDSQNGDDLIWSPGSQAALLSLINNAQTSVDIYNEEMALPAITSALEDAEKRGVAVRIVMTYSSSWKKAFQELAAAGVDVRTYAAKAPLYIHTKVVIADDAKAFVGSENFSSNSLNKNRELGILISDQAVINSLEQTFEKDRAKATAFAH